MLVLLKVLTHWAGMLVAMDTTVTDEVTGPNTGKAPRDEARWLSEEERQLAVFRLQEDIGEDDWTSAEEQTFFHGFKLALMDIKTWIFTVLLLSIVSSASVTNFFPVQTTLLVYLIKLFD